MSKTKGGPSLKWVAMAVSVIFIVAFAWLAAFNYFGVWNLAGINLQPSPTIVTTPEGQVVTPTVDMTKFYEHGGTIDFTNTVYWSYDDATQSSNLPVVKYFHADKEKLGGLNSSDVQLWVSDVGIMYMVVDFGSEATYFLDSTQMVSGYVVEQIAPMVYDPADGDYDDDGTIEWYYKLDFTTIPKTDSAIYDVNVNMYVAKYDAVTISGIANVTTVASTAYNYFTAEAYVSFTGEGYMSKITRVKIDTNSTYAEHVENGSLTPKSLAIGAGDYYYKFTGYDWDYGTGIITWDLGLTSSDELQEVYAKELYYERGAGSRWCKIEYKIYAKFGGQHWAPLKIYYLTPASVIASVTYTFKFS